MILFTMKAARLRRIWLDRCLGGAGLAWWPFGVPLWWCPWWCWDLVFLWRSGLTGCWCPCWDVVEGAEAFSSNLVLLFVSVSRGILELQDGMLLSKPILCEWSGYLFCWLPWRFPDVTEVFPSRGSPSGPILGLIHDHSERWGEKREKELFAKRTETKL